MTACGEGPPMEFKRCETATAYEFCAKNLPDPFFLEKSVPAIIMELVQEGPVTVAHVAEVAGVTKRTASSHLNRLAAEGAIIAHGETKSRRYKLSPR